MINYEIEFQKLVDFWVLYTHNHFPGQRVGQAFYNHFNLHKLNNQRALKNLYNKDGKEAIDLIGELFVSHEAK